MTTNDTKKKILVSDEFVLSEVIRIQTLYKLKQVIRYEGERDFRKSEDSVAEHIFAASLLARYFLPLEDPEGNLHKEKIYDMILIHDLDEVETGDTIGYLKTERDRVNERTALSDVVEKLPKVMQSWIKPLSEEYEARESGESKFVKAIDAIEPVFHLYNEGGKHITRGHNQRYEQHRMIKDKHVAQFPCIKRFNDVIGERMHQEKFFID